MLRRHQRALLDQQIRWLRWMAMAAPSPLPQYAPWQVQADHLLALEAEFGGSRSYLTTLLWTMKSGRIGQLPQVLAHAAANINRCAGCTIESVSAL